MAFEFNRNQQDLNYTSTVTVLSGGANTATFDLEQAGLAKAAGLHAVRPA